MPAAPTTSPTPSAVRPTPALASTRTGVLTGIGCYVFWGLCPVFWKLLGAVNPFEVIANRIIWSLAFMVLVCRVMHLDYLGLLRSRRTLRYLLPASLLITVIWSVYIWAVAAGNLVECALGYYINPLMSILFGVVFFKEKLTRLQTAATLLMAAGVLYFSVAYGQIPWIALALALTFALYGVVKKKGGCPPIEAIAVENTLAAPIGLAIGVATALITGGHAFLADPASVASWGVTGLLVLAGPVTAIPLVLFSKAANNIPLSLLGFIQYVSPTLSLLLGVFAYGEAFTSAHAVCFACIWVGLALVSFEAVRGSLGRPRGGRRG